MNNKISDYLTYANLQMLAEATGVKVGKIPTEKGEWADIGNNRSSKTPLAVAQQMHDAGWIVVAYQPNTATGFSATLFKNSNGEYVMSIRSTEFIDDAVRDNMATNDLEVKDLGFSLGQLSDLEKWYQKAVKPLTGGADLTVTGYSLGGHLATAFEQAHHSEVKQVYTINGAGVGKVIGGHTLDQVRAEFDKYRDAKNDLAAMGLFTHDNVKRLYSFLRDQLTADPFVSDFQIAQAKALTEPIKIQLASGPYVFSGGGTADAQLLYDALVRIKKIQDEWRRVGRPIVNGKTPPMQVGISEIAGVGLNYQLSALHVKPWIESVGLPGMVGRTVLDWGARDNPQGNITDLLGNTYWSAVSNSQFHHGTKTPIFIENQPLYRGDILDEVAKESMPYLQYFGIKLLVDNFSQNDFGDTHSLVLLQDSLSVQDTLVKLDPTQNISSVGSLLHAASNASVMSDAPTQGQCDGDTLEHAVDGLVRLFADAGATPTPDKQTPVDGIQRSRNEGGTWANIEDRNTYLHARLKQLTDSGAYKSIAGQVRLEVASADLANRAKTDFTALACLLAGSTIAIVPKDAAAKTKVEAALGTVWKEEYQLWKKDRDLDDKDRAAGKANFSDEYLASRAAFFSSLVFANQNNHSLANVGATLGGATLHAKDWATGIEIGSNFGSASRQVQFGRTVADSLTGTSSHDSIFGGGGNDTLAGAGDDDWLEGNRDNDQLDGGTGDDTLLGGQGSDTYTFSGNFGEDVVIDSDDQGSIRINGSTVETTKSAGRNFWVTKTGDGKLYTLEVISDSRSSTGKTLLIKPADQGFASDLVWIRNFKLSDALSSKGYLGIKLEPQRALVIATANSGASLAPQDNGGDPFDVARAWDFNKDSVQTVKAEAAERTGQNFTIYLNQGASEGDTLTIKVAGSAGKTKLIADGKVIEVSGDTVLQLEEGQTELSFALIGADAIDADKTLHVTATWQSTAALGMNQLTAAPAESNALDLTLKDNGAVIGQYFGDVRAPIDGQGRYEWEKTTWQPLMGGYLEHGESEAGFNDVISSSGGQRVDEMDGKGGNDALDGGGGNDQIKGSEGNDLLAGGAGHDYLQGGEGNDVILSSSTLAVYSPVNTHDPDWAARGGLGAWAQAETWGVYDPYHDGAIRLTFQQPDGTEYSGVSGDAKDTSGDVVEGGAGNDLVAGSWGDDAIFGEADDDNLRGLAGDDALSGGDGNDWMAGDGIDYAGHIETVMGADQGYDQMDGGAGNDTMSGDAKDDALTGGDGNDEMYGDWSLFVCDFDRLSGTYHGDDELDGGAGDDKISGDGGHDTLIGGLGSDTLRGDAAFTGDDALDGQYHGMDSLDGGEGDDRLYGDGEADWLEGGDGNDQLQGDSKDTKVEFHGNDSLDGGAGNDILQGDGGDDWLFGGDDAGDDQLRGDSDDIDGADHGADTLDGGDGADQLTGDGGQDSLIGGDGNDRLYGDNTTLGGKDHGADVLEGGAGNDQLTGGGKADTLDGGEGDDRMWGDDASLGQGFHGNDDMDGGAGNDTLQGQWGDDTVLGGEGDDWVAGGDESSTDGTSTMGGDDALFGEAGNDTVLGGLGNDTLSGGDGDDVLAGGAGDDVLEGGAGSDVLMGGEGNDSYYIDTTGLTVGTAERISDTQGSNSIYIRGSATQVDESGGDLTLTFGEGQQLIIEGGLKGGVNGLYFVGDSSQGETQSAEATQTNDATGFAEWLQLNFWKPVDLTAAAGTSALYGGSGNDKLTASTGTITLNGGWGDDAYYVKAANQTVVEYDHGGVDSVYSDVSFTLGAAVENLVLTGNTNLTGTGNELDNQITGAGGMDTLAGGDGNDTLDGGANADSLVGGAGDDTYKLSSTSDKVSEAAGAGLDTIEIAATTSLVNFANVENLTLTGTSGYTGTGNTLANLIKGNGGANTLSGGDGNDTLDGGAGSDSLKGNKDNDTYVVDVAGDTITEVAGEGNDTVQSSIVNTDLDLNVAKYANVENGTLLEAAGAVKLTGTSTDNVLIGNTFANTLTGNDGNDTLIGGGGDDVLNGGVGDDTYFVDSTSDQIVDSAGTDTVLAAMDWTLATNTENLTLVGGVWANATGNSGNNKLTGNDGNNKLDGEGGNDVMAGGLGDDTYVVDSSGDVTTEVAGQGTDVVQVGYVTDIDLNLTRFANIENATLLDAAVASKLTGTADGNLLTGNASNNTLIGNGGNDWLDGAGGVDVMTGGVGDDTYVVDSAQDVITEKANEGRDAVRSNITVTAAMIGSYIEDIVLTGADAIDATGNTMANSITGNGNTNTLTGGGGDDALDGGGGSDVLKGGAGNDTYVINNTGVTISESSGQGSDTVKSSVTTGLGNNVENLTLVGAAAINGTGNGLANNIEGNEAANTLGGAAGDDVITGGAGNDTIDGGAGNDRMTGGTGDDSYTIDSASDSVVENDGEGNDTAKVSASWAMTANLENAVLTGTGITVTGNALNNTLTGDALSNTLAGGLGDDVYVLAAAGDTVSELLDQGKDTVLQGYANTVDLAANVENLVLTGTAKTGTGNGLANVLSGNDSVNKLVGQGGNDTLFGGGGKDTLVGGLGDDLFILDATGDVVTESANQGIDTVQADVSEDLAAVSAAVENLVLTGTSAINGTGNSLANHIWGNAAANVLVGGGNEDTLEGGAGNDAYTRDSAGDVIIETYAGGADSLTSSISTTLDANVENLQLTGAATVGTGNDLDNQITGGTNNDTLRGGIGNDTLDGGAAGIDSLEGGDGNDVYVIGAPDQAQARAQSTASSACWYFADMTEDFALDPRRLGGHSLMVRRRTPMPVSMFSNAQVAASSDVIKEDVDGGVDTVRSSVTVTLADNVENLVLTGSAALSGTGNGLANGLVGNSGKNTLTGADGNDTLDGAGNTDILKGDALKGGKGDDTFIIHSDLDVVTELSGVGTGTDTVQRDFDSTKALADNVENLVLLGTSDIRGTGNTLKNRLTGNDGKNRLDGGGGDDVMAGGKGDDTYVVDTIGDKIEEGTDGYGNDSVEASITMDLGKLNYQNVENVTLTGNQGLGATGSNAANLLIGNTGNNQLSGLGGDDTLDGGTAGTDVLAGGQGNDTYVLRAGGGVTITELANEGSDTVIAGFTVNVASYQNVENVTLTGNANLDATGDAVNNTLTGNAGSNRLDGGVGNDKMSGGVGNDTYVLDSIADQAIESAGEGSDTLEVMNFTGDLRAFANIENVTVTGTGNIDASGNAGNNVLTGNSGNNLLIGREGNDTLSGGIGDDTLQGDEGSDELIDDAGASDVMLGNAGADIYRVGAASAPVGNRYVKVYGGSDGDVLYLADGIRPEDVTKSVNNSSLVLTISGTKVASFQIELVNQFAGGQVSEVHFASGVVWSGSDLAGNALVGTEGNDYLHGNSNLDVPECLMGLGGNDSLYGFGGNDTLVGGTGNDWMCGHDGDDMYEFGANAGIDLAWEHANDGNDTIRFVDGIKPADLQVFRVGGDLEGTNSESLVLRVTATGAQVWVRDFFLEEGNGKGTVERFQFSDGTVWTFADIMSRVGPKPQANTQTGTSNDDQFVVDHYADVVTDGSSSDHDTLTSNISFTLPDNVERLVLTGVLNLTATGSSGRDEIVGNDGDNLIDGRYGVDMLAGGLGDDVYIDHRNDNGAFYSPGYVDTILEEAGQGHDLVKTDHAYRDLESNVEDMLVESNAYYVYDVYDGFQYDRAYNGNDLNNRIQIDVADGPRTRVDGGLGDDTMIGSSSSQTFVIDSTRDVVIDTSDRDMDYVQTSGAYVLGDHLEGLLLTGAQAVSGTGNGANNLLDGTGNGASNALYGLGGDDVYRLGAGDTANEAAGEGSDTVEVGDESVEINGVLDLARYANIENLTAAFDTSANMSLLGTDGDNRLQGPGGYWGKMLDGKAGNDVLNETSFGTSMDTLLGGAGNDTLISHGGEDWLDGGQGDDVYQVGYQLYGLFGAVPEREGQHIRLGNGSGHDRAQYDGEFYWQQARKESTYDDRGDYVYVATLQNIVDRDWLLANRSVSVDLDSNIDPTGMRLARSGDDLTVTLGGGDSLTVSSFYSSGTNTVISPVDQIGFGGAFITGAQMAQAVGKTNFSTATAGDDLLIEALGSAAAQSGGNGNDYLAGGALGQSQDGGAGNDTLVAGDGDDTLMGGAGGDILCGGRGSDRYVFGANWGQDTLNEYNLNGLNGSIQSQLTLPDGQSNTIVFSDPNLKASDLTFEWVWGEGLTIRNKVTGDSIFVIGDAMTAEGADPNANTEAYIDRIEFANGTVWDRHQIETVWRIVEGTAADDNLHDNAANNLVFGYGGNDTLTADFIETELYGGDGDDTLTTTVDSGPFGDGIYMHGDAGNDSITGGAFYDLLDGGTGSDTMTGGAGDDTYYVDSSTDRVIEASGGGDDTVYASSSNNLLADNVESLYLESSGGAIDGTGNAMNNWIEGNEFANSLNGGAGSGRDTLVGGAGNDTFEAGLNLNAGMDTMIGGTGADTYYFTAPAAASDTIQEFDSDGIGETSAVHDKVWFGNKALDAFNFWKDGDDLLVTWKDTHYSSSKLRIDDWYLSTDYQVEDFVFSSGSVTKTAAQIEALAKPYPGASPKSELPTRRRFGDPSSELVVDQNGGHRQPLDVSRLIQAMASFDSSGALHTSGSHLLWGEQLIGRPVDVAVHALLV